MTGGRVRRILLERSGITRAWLAGRKEARQCVGRREPPKRSLCRAYTDESVRHLAAIMRQPEFPPSARVQAITILLERLAHVRKTLCRSALQGMSRDGPSASKQPTEVLGGLEVKAGRPDRQGRSPQARAKRADPLHLHPVAMASAIR
jgi:hypothetical protein